MTITFQRWVARDRPDIVRVYVNGMKGLPEGTKVYFREGREGLAELEVKGELWDSAYSISDIVQIVREQLSIQKGFAETGPLDFHSLASAFGKYTIEREKS